MPSPCRRAVDTRDRASSVEDIEERLSGIEKALWVLTESVEGRSRSCSSSGDAHYGPTSKKRSRQLSDTVDLTEAYVHRAIFGPDEQQERETACFRPCTLSALCDETHEAISSSRRLVMQEDEDLGAVMRDLSREMRANDSIDLLPDGLTLPLPPRQLLALACVPFFDPSNMTAEIFSRESFSETIDQVYRAPNLAENLAWALSFNLIVLSGLGMGQSAGTDGEFLRPFLDNVTRACGSGSILLTPSVANVQALALLVSTTAQHHNPDAT